MRRTSEPALTPLPLPDGPFLLALVGAAGSGKSRVARAFPPDWRLELDNYRWQATGSPGDQSATPIASVVFRELLDARLTRNLPVLADSTNSERGVRAYLIQRARHWRMPTVAIVFRVPVEECLARQETRTKAKQVPPDAITRQAAGVPTLDQLIDEGFDHAYYADELDLLGLLLCRAATADPDPLADVRRTFGEDLAAVFAWHSERQDGFATGTFAVASREITVRWMDDGDPYDHQWQARLNEACTDGCPGPLWVKVTDAADLQSVHLGGAPDEPWCDGCHSHSLAFG
ncbi:AAA family ATPase [Streptomyces capitiformicae]|uniref:ATP/GTP-binding protein n=1 Tax=Streptomyces capitiformicae TaxID=2014920 RepID=A0A919DD12_9ACTN|nr:AAA family ATPase [Streptomyces capitiformicae]GHE34174.1 ATP/GTP-binding protein [Streptomyces capitiformicae]